MANLEIESGGGYTIAGNHTQKFYFWWPNPPSKDNQYFDVGICPSVPGTLRIRGREINCNRDESQFTLILEIENENDSEITFTANHIRISY